MSAFDLTHHFLLAMPSLDNSCFEKSLIYIIDHDEECVTGLIINIPCESSFLELLKEIQLSTPESNQQTEILQNKSTTIDSSVSKNEYLCSDDVLSTPLLYGGPVGSEQPFILYDSPQCWPGAHNISDNIHLTSNLDIVQDIANNKGPEKHLIILGYAGWSSDQLADELINNDWLTLPANSDILFNTPYEIRQQEAAAQIGVDITQISTQVGHA